MPKAVLLFAVSLCTLVGCKTASVSRFIIIDDVSGLPIAGASGAGIFDMWQPGMPGLPVHIRLGVEEATSDSSGIMQFRGERSYFEFTREGYEPIAIEPNAWGGLCKDRKLDFLHLLPRLTIMEDGTVVVPLHQKALDCGPIE